MHEVSHASKILPASLGYRTAAHFTAREAEADLQRTNPSNNGLQQQVPAQGVPAILPGSHIALPMCRSFPFYKGSTHHYSILQTVKTRDKTLEGLPKRQPVEGGGKPHLLVLDSI